MFSHCILPFVFYRPVKISEKCCADTPVANNKLKNKNNSPHINQLKFSIKIKQLIKRSKNAHISATCRFFYSKRFTNCHFRMFIFTVNKS